MPISSVSSVSWLSYKYRCVVAVLLGDHAVIARPLSSTTTVLTAAASHAVGSPAIRAREQRWCQSSAAAGDSLRNREAFRQVAVVRVVRAATLIRHHDDAGHPVVGGAGVAVDLEHGGDFGLDLLLGRGRAL